MSVNPLNVQEITKEFEVKVQVDQGVNMVRGAHPRHHAIVKAEFRVEPNLPPDLRKGLFATGKTYKAYVRFSNAGGAPHDGMTDFRGMAIKVMGVEGEKLLPREVPENEATTQDFHLTNFPTFFAKDPEDLLKFLRKRREIREVQVAQRGVPLDKDKQKGLDELNTQLKKDFPVINGAGVIRNPFRVSYFSQTPYALGSDTVVKYQARPRLTESPVSETEAMTKDKFYLRQAMVETLKGGEDVWFDFMVQRQTDQNAMPIEDPRLEWKSPFEPVATIRIPAGQEFESAAQMRFAENISFSPWHSLKEHEPLGELNKARRDVYRDMARFRHHHNQVPYKEPSGVNDF
jgi:catalase